MISERGMSSLRVAATLTHVLPGLGARIRHGDAVILDIGPTTHGEPPSRRITPAAFRCAVARAHRRRLGGEQLRFLDLEEGCDPVVDIGVPHHGTGRPGGIFCVPVAGRWLWGMASTIEASTAYDLGTGLVEAALPATGVHALGIRPDPATDVSVTYAETCTGPGSASEPWVQELFESLLARWTVHELVNQLSDQVDVNRGSA